MARLDLRHVLVQRRLGPRVLLQQLLERVEVLDELRVRVVAAREVSEDGGEAREDGRGE